MKLKSITALTAALILTASVALSPRAEAQTSANAEAVYNGYLSAYLVQSGSTAYFKYSTGTTSTDTAMDYMWRQAEDITGVEDYWYRTHSSATATLVSDLLNTFEANNGGTNWSGDNYDDDLGWATIAFVRGYDITGNSGFLTAAETNFNTVWSRGWDSSGGGGIWEQVGSGNEVQRSVLATGTFIVTGAALYQATGNSTYLSEAETAYAWVRANVFNATSSTNSIGAPGHVDEGLTNTGALQNTSHVYNEGLMLESAAALYTLTNNSEYLNDAKLIATYTMNEWPLLTMQSDMFLRGLSNFAWQNNLWSTYLPYLNANATASWNERRTDYNITEDNFTVASSTGTDITAMGAMSSLTVQQVTALSWMPPTTTSFSGTWELQNVNSGLAVNVKGASKTSGAIVVQYPFISGQTNSLWTFVPTGGGYYRIQNVNSGLDINVSAASDVIGALIIQYPAVTSSPYNDQWLPVANSDGSYSFYNLATTLALEVPGASKSNDTQLDQWYSNGATNQEFKLIAQ